MADDDKDSFQEMMDEIASKQDAQPHTCPFANGGGMGFDGLGGMGGLGGLMGGMGMMGGMGGMGGMGRMGELGGGFPPSIDPIDFSKILLDIMEALEGRIQEAIGENELGVCPQVKPMDIFLSKTPYLAYEEILSMEEGHDAVDKINALKSDLQTFLGALPN